MKERKIERIAWQGYGLTGRRIKYDLIVDGENIGVVYRTWGFCHDK